MRPLRHPVPGDTGTGAAPQDVGRGRRFLLCALLLLAAAIFVLLGLWQVQRLFWKLDLIARVEERVAASPVAPPPPSEWPKIDPEDFEYRRLQVTGRFDHQREVAVQAVTERGPGFWILAPLQLDDGTVILINRGFVPPDKRNPEARPADSATGTVTITGLLRMSEPGGGFLRANDPAADRWYSRDVEAIAAAKGVGKHAPFFIDADATPNGGGLPIGGLTVLKFHNSHLAYIVTWFSLAAMALCASFFVLRYREPAQPVD